MKQDINLMPPVERNTNKVVQGMIVFLLIVLVLGAGIYFGILQPMNQKNILQTQLDHYLKQIEDYGDLQQEYSDLKTQQEQMGQLMVAMDSFKEDIQWTTLWKEIDGCLPSDLTFGGLNYSEHTVSIVGVTGLDDATLSVMINKLRQLEDVTDVSIGSYSESEATQSFNMTIMLGSTFDIDIQAETNTEAEAGGQAS